MNIDDFNTQAHAFINRDADKLTERKFYAEDYTPRAHPVAKVKPAPEWPSWTIAIAAGLFLLVEALKGRRLGP